MQWSHGRYVTNEYSTDATAYEFAAPDYKDAGDEIFISYGDGKTTYHFTLFYGFVPYGFEAGDYIVLDLPLSVASRAAEMHLAQGAPIPSVLQAALDETSLLLGFVGSDGRLSDAFLDLLQSLAPPVMAVSSSTGRRTPLTHVQRLVNAVQTSIHAWPTTLEADEQRLVTKAGVYDDESVALSARIRFKRIVLALEANLRHYTTHGGWSGIRHDKSIVYHFDDDKVNLSPTEAANEGLFKIQLSSLA